MSPRDREEIDFADALELLVAQAHTDPLSSGPENPPRPSSEPAVAAPQPMTPSPAGRESGELARALRPLVMAVDALVRSGAENSKRLGRLEDNVKDAPEIPVMLKELREAVEIRGGVTRALFDALHEELKSYKDNLLLDLLLKPVIRDLISYYDDLTLQHSELTAFVGEARKNESGSCCLDRLIIVAENLDHSTHMILETLARIEVEIVPPAKGKLDRTKQKAITVEVTDNPAEDGDVVRSLRVGFRWRDRLFRPEEVVVKKYKEGYLVAFDREKGEPDST